MTLPAGNMTMTASGLQSCPDGCFRRRRTGQERLLSSRGFTILELLIAMTLLTIMLAITLGAVRTGSQSLAAGEKRMEAQERLRTVLAILDAQIQSQIPQSYEAEEGKRYYFNGESKKMRFLTNYSIWDGQKGYVVCDYGIEQESGGGEALYAQEQRPGREDSLRIRMIGGSGMSFAYYYKSPAEEEGRWIDHLTDGTEIPEKIKFTLEPGPQGISRIFPVRVPGKDVFVRTGGGGSR